MSIINDALKKARERKQLFQSSAPQILSGGNMKNNRSVASWLVWLCVGVIFLAGLFWLFNSSGKSAKYAAIKTPASGAQGSVFNLRGVDFESSLQAAKFNLSGILFDTQKPLAIINNRIVQEGSVVDGAQLLEIQPDYVKLSLKGKEVRLKVK